MTQERDHMLANSEIVPQSSNKSCHSFTQRDQISQQSDLLHVEECSSKELTCTATKETAGKIELDSTVIGKES